MELKRLDAVTVAQLDAFDEVIDVRSPAEFALDHVPSAVNCPVLDDSERAHVGMLYKQISPFDAKKIGAALVAKNIAQHIDEHFRGRGHGWRPLVYCWRGGPPPPGGGDGPPPGRRARATPPGGPPGAPPEGQRPAASPPAGFPFP